MMKLKMKYFVRLLFSTTIVCVHSKNIRSAPSDKVPDENVSSSNGRAVTLPLLTYHTLKQRRMLEMGLDEAGMELYLDSLPTTNHYNNSTSRRMSIEVGGMYQGYGTHYVDLWVGTPPQRQTVIVDTGSSVTAFPCSSCYDCGSNYHASPFFVEADSVSFRRMNCDACDEDVGAGACYNQDTDDEYCKIGVSYQEGSSWSAYQSEDMAYIGGPHDHALDAQPFGTGPGNHLGAKVVDEDPADAAKFRFPLQFGCQTKITGLFKTQLADGIMGMSMENGSFWKQMYHHEVIDHQGFSLCFRSGGKSEKSGTPAGAVTMGGTDTKLHKSPMVFARGKIDDGFYGVMIRKVYFMKGGQYHVMDATPDNTIKLDTKEKDLNHGGVILDSGTTNTYLHRSIADTFMDNFKKLVGVDFHYQGGMKLSDDQLKLLPSLIIQLDGAQEAGQVFDPSNPDATPGLAGKLDPDRPNDVLVVVQPTHFFEYDGKKKVYKPKIIVTESGESTLGANFLAGHDVMFDIPDNKRVGFAESDCNYVNLIKDSHTGSKGIADFSTR